jgi:hypothetical protein
MQTSYSQQMAQAYPGMIADVQTSNTILSKDLETALITPGLSVGRGTDKDRQVVLGGVAPIGIVVRALTKANNAAGELEYEATDTVGIMTKGAIWVELAGAGNAGDPIHSVDATGVIGAGVAIAGQTQLNGVLETTVAGAGLAVVRLEEQGN